MKLAGEVGQLREQVEELGEELGRLQRENRQLRAENATLQAENAQLRQQMAEGAAAGGRAPHWVKPKRPKKAPSVRKKRAAQHNKARRREAPTAIEKHSLSDCPVCGEGLVGGSLHYRRQVIEIPPPPPVEVIEHHIEKRWCRRCRRWRWPEVNWTGVVLDSGRVGIRLIGLLAYLRASLRLPLATIQHYLATVHQVKLSVGEISRLLQQTAKHLTSSRQQLLEGARASPVAHMDETGWRQDGQNGYIWCLVSDQPQPVRYYEYDASRSQAVAGRLLGDFAGHLVSDFYGGYNGYSGAHQRCWPHLLRDLHELRDKHSQDGEIVAWALGIKELYGQAKGLLAAAPTVQERGQLYSRLWEMTRLFALPYAQAEHPCRPLAKRLLRHLDELFQFLLYPAVPADNNLAERALRPLVVQRKISGGSRSSQGSATRMALASSFETWKARQRNPLLECWRQLGLFDLPATA